MAPIPSAGGDIRRRPLLSRRLRPVLFAAVGLALLGGWSFLRFGSISAGLAYLRGYRVFAERDTVWAGEVAAGTEATVAFQLRNLASSPVRVLGAKSDCACLALDDLPWRSRRGPGGK